MENPGSKKSISIEYEGVDDAPRIPVSGVYGGLANDGMITAAFYHEQSIPEAQRVSLDESGDESSEETISGADLTRNVLAVAQMSPQQAISIGKWLIEKGIVSMKETPQPELEDLLDELGFQITDSE